MSDIKMSDVFDLPVKLSKWMINRLNKNDMKAVAFAINNHDKLTSRVAELEAVIGSRPKHCEYMNEDGDFNDLDKYVDDVSAWAFKARKALKESE